MKHITGTRASLLFALTLAPMLDAQSGASIARRVAAAPDGEVRMSYATRAHVCGDGRDAVSIGRSLHVHPSMESHGSWSGIQCATGPARVTLTLRDHKVAGLRTRVGGSWPRASAGTDLGAVPAAEAAAYFLSLVPALEAVSSRINPLLAAAVADSANVSPEMLRIARMTTISRETRKRAVHWSGALGDASTVRPLVELARASGGATSAADDPGPGDGLEGAATGALAMIPGGVGIPALMELAKSGSTTVRKAAVFWIGQRDEPNARALVRTIAADERESETVRSAAIFALSQGESSTTQDETFLESLFTRLTSEKLKERVLFSISQRESADGARWLLDQARDERQDMEVRRKAVFWAGQGRATVAELVALFTSTREERLREHLIFVLSQKQEEAATTALMSIAKSDADREMRKKALFWLAQKDDPRVTKMITDIVIR